MKLLSLRQSIDLANFSSEKRINQRRFSGVHLTADDKEKRLPEIF